MTLAFTAVEENEWKLMAHTIGQHAAPKPIRSRMRGQHFALGWLPDQRSLLHVEDAPQATPSILAPGEQPRALPFPASGKALRYFHGVSPDGRWLAYVSDSSTQWEIYVTSLPDGTITRQVSRNGGVSPVWAKTGSDLYYRRPCEIHPGEIMRRTVRTDTPLRAAISFHVCPARRSTCTSCRLSMSIILSLAGD